MLNRKVVSFAIAISMIFSALPVSTQDFGEETRDVGQSESSLIGSGGLADSPWPMFGQNPNHTGLSIYDTSANPGKLRWSFRTGSNVFSSPTIDSEGTIYVGSMDYKLYAIYPDGTQKWNFTTKGEVYSSPAIGFDGTIYVGSGAYDHKLYAINPNGTEKWNFTTYGPVKASPTIGSDGTIYVGSWDGKLYAINTDGTMKWSFTAGDFIFSSAAISSDGTIYFSSRNDKLYALYPDGTEKWSFTTGNDMASSPAIGSDGTIYVGSYDHKLYAINPDGTEKWNFDTGASIGSSAAIGSDSTIYISSWGNKLYAINPDGTEKWHFTADHRVRSSSAIGSDGTIYIGSADNKLYAINPNGTEKWSFMTGWYVSSSPSIGSDGTIYVGSWDYKLYAIGTPIINVDVTSHFTELNSAAQSAITVHVTDGTNPIQGATVNLDSDNGGIFSPQSGITDANGDFKSIFNAPTVTSQIISRITAQASKTGYNDGSGDVDVTLIPIPWPMFRHNLNHTGVSPYDTSKNPGKLKWTFETNGRVFSSPVIGSDGTIYIGLNDRKLYAINPDGIEKWNYTTVGSIDSSPAIDSEGTIYVGSWNNKFYAINPDGTEKWNFPTSGNIWTSSPTIGSDGTIYFGSYEDCKLFAINPDGSQKWNFTTGGEIRSSPAIATDGTIYIGSTGNDNKLYSINPDGTKKWSYQALGNIISSPAIGFDGTIYVGSSDTDPTFHAVNPDGTKKWSLNIGSSVYTSPAIGSDGSIYFGSYPYIHAVNPDGTEKWKFKTGNSVSSSPAIGSDGTIYLASQDHKVYAINPDGTQKWDFPTGDAVLSSPAIGSDGTIYIGSLDNNLYAIGTTTQNQPPIADAGPDQTVKEGDVVQFDGTGSYDPDGGTGDWVPRANIPSPRSSGGSAVLDNEIYYVGGGLGDMGPGLSDFFQKYTPATDSWSDLPSLPQERTWIGAAAVNGKIYAIGGEGGYGTRNTTYEFDPSTGTWTEKAPMPIAMAAFGIAVVDDRIYTIGGASLFLNCTWCNIVYEYNTTTDTWFQKSNLPTARSHLAATTLNGKIYAIGGKTWGATCPNEVYDPTTDKWTARTPSTYRWGLCAEALEGKIYVFGGTTGGDLATDKTEVYDPTTDTWTTITPMLDIRQEFGSGIVGNCIYAVGGHRGWMAGYPDNSERYCLGGDLTYEWDFDADVDSDGDGNYTNDVDATGPKPTHVYGDDGVYTVTLTVKKRVEGEGAEKVDQDAIFCVDTSGSMLPESVELAKEGLLVYVDEMDVPDMGAVVVFGLVVGSDQYVVELLSPLTTNYTQMKQDIASIPGPQGMTPMGEALQVAIDELLANGSSAHVQVIILLTDGYSNGFVDPNVEAMRAAANNITIFTIGLGDAVDTTTLQNIANRTGGAYYYSPNASYLSTIYREIAQLVEQSSGEELSDMDTMEVTVKNAKPNINSISSPSGGEGSPITFTSKVTDVGSDDLTFTWNWGDGTSTIVNKYYNDGLGLEPIYNPAINEIKSPLGTYPFTVTDTVQHIYGDNGVYTVTLEVEDDDHGASFINTTVVVNNVVPSVSLVIVPSGEEGSELIFEAEVTDFGSDDLTFEWEFEYGPTIKNIYYNDCVGSEPVYDPIINEIKSPWGTYPFNASDTINHTYGDNYNYTLVLTVSDDDGGTVTYTSTISIDNIAPSIVKVWIPYMAYEGTSAAYGAVAQDNGSDDLTFEWDFGDSTPIIENTYYNDGANPDPYPSPDGTYPFTASDSLNHTYGDDYNYTLTLKVSDDDGGMTSFSTTVFVNNVAPAIELFLPITIPEEGMPFTLFANSTDPGSDDLKFTWEFEYGPSITNVYYNDGLGPDPYPSPWGTFPFSVQDMVGHTYGDNGIYSINLTVEDDDGAITTVTTNITVNNVAPTIEPFGPFTVDEGSILNITAIAKDQGSDDLNFTWEFELGPTITNIYYNNGLAPDPYPSPFGTYPFSVNDTVGHTYGDDGVYVVSLTVMDDDGGSINYTTNITVKNVAPTIELREPFIVDEGMQINVSGLGADPGSDDLTFTWEFEFGPTITNTFYNDGVGPDPYPSPWGTFPFNATDTVTYTYGDNGVYWITVTIEDEDGGLTNYTTNVTVNNVAPTIGPFGPFTVDEGISFNLTATSTDQGSDDLKFMWEFEMGPSISNSYYNDGVAPDPHPSPWGIYPFSATDIVEHIYGDNGIHNVTLTVEDDDGGSTTYMTNITVNNVAPTITNIEVYMYVNFTLRVAGEKWHSVELYLYEDDLEIWAGKVTRYPGSPDEQATTITHVRVDMTKSYSALVDYLPNDPRENGNVWGGNPVWIDMAFVNGSTKRLHHTFNVRQSDWDSDHWNHIDPWEVNLNQNFVGQNITFEVSANDQGSDDLTFIWDWGDGSQNNETTYYNDGTNPDPYPSPWGIYPFSASDVIKHAYTTTGDFTVTLTVTDDDGGVAISTISINLS